MELIDKSALIAEIEKRIRACGNCYVLDELASLYSSINTLDVKEVDLETEMNKEWNKCVPIDEGMGLEIASIEHEQFDNIAKHFYELGFKAQKGE